MVPDSASLVSQYWIPQSQLFWKWDWDSLTAGKETSIPNVLWSEGPTLCLGQELEKVLNGLASTGAPPLTIILLILAATRDDRTQLMEGAGSRALQYWKEDCQLSHEQIESITSGLSAIQRLPRKLRIDAPAKIHLLQCLFPKDTCHTPEATREIQSMRREFGLKNIADWPVPQDVENGAREAWMLAEAFKNLGPQNFRSLLETGMNRTAARSSFNNASQLVIPYRVISPSIRQTDPEDHREIIKALSEESRYTGIAKLVQAFEAALETPRRLEDQGPQKDGGYSDISNRGEPDRLLLSELAQDPEALSIRMAHGEALYLQRRSLPSEPDVVRWIFLDTGPWVWGRLRLVAAAVALALSRKKITADQAQLFFLTDQGATPGSLRTFGNWKEFLQLTHGSTSPLADLILDPTLKLPKVQDDVFLISAAPAFQDQPTTTQLLNHIRSERFYSVELQSDGVLEMGAFSSKGRLPLKKMKLEWSRFVDEDTSMDQSGIANATSLPRFYQQRPYAPLYFSSNPSILQRYEIDNKGYQSAGVTRDGAVFYWNRTRQLGRLITRGLNLSALQEFGWSHGSLYWTFHDNDRSAEIWSWIPGSTEAPSRIDDHGSVDFDLEFEQLDETIDSRLQRFPVLSPTWSREWTAVIRDHHGRIGLAGPEGLQRVFEFKTFLKHECKLARTGANCSILGRLTPWMGFEKIGLQLLHTELANGVHVFLDQYGMLSLSHPKWSAPELTQLVLTNRPMTAWSSDGVHYGPSEYLWDEERGEVSDWDDLFHGYFDKA